MFKIINNNEISLKDCNTIEKNKNNNIILYLNEKEQEKSEKKIPNINPKIFQNINSGKNNSLLEGESIAQKNNISKIKKNLIFNISKIRKRKKHDAFSGDNIKQAIIRHFIDFFLEFVNLVVKTILKKEKNKEINLEEIQFKIGFIIKRKIKVKDIRDLTVEKFLNLDEEKKDKNSQQNDNISNNNKNVINNNKRKLIIIRDFLSSSLDKFFDTPVISLFKGIYAEKKERIDLEEYGIPKIVIKLPKNMKTFKKLKENQINKQKVKKMNNLIMTEFINPKKRRLKKKFKIKKQE